MASRMAASAVALALVSAGCGYTSSYVPPDGWRARPLYHGNEVIMVGGGEVPVCAGELAEVEPGAGGPPPMYIDSGGYWAPVRVNVFYIGPHPPVLLPHPYVFSPPGPHNLFGPAMLKGFGGGGGGSGKGGGMVAALAAAILVVASSGIAIGLAADPPEDDDDVAEGIDAVNRHNDQVRRKVAECYAAAEAAQARAQVEVVASAPAGAVVRTEVAGAAAVRTEVVGADGAPAVETSVEAADDGTTRAYVGADEAAPGEVAPW